MMMLSREEHRLKTPIVLSVRAPWLSGDVQLIPAGAESLPKLNDAEVHQEPTRSSKRPQSVDETGDAKKQKPSLDSSDPPSNRTQKSPSNTTEDSPYTAQIFRDMADTISAVFPPETFATQHDCNSEQVTQAIDALVMGPLTDPRFTQVDRWAEKSQRNDKNGKNSRASVAIPPVCRREVWQDEFGNYVSVEEDDRWDTPGRREIDEERRLCRLRGDLNIFLNKGR